MRVSVIVALVVFLSTVSAQSAKPDHPIPSSEVVFTATPEGGAPFTLPSFMVSRLPICYSADSCSLNVLPDSENRSRELPVLFGVSGKTRAIDPAAVEGLSYVQVITSAPTADGLAVLVHAATSGSGTGERVVPKPGGEPDKSKLHDGFFLCFFDRDGNPKGVYPIDSRYDPTTIAYLGNDQLLLFVYDRSREGPVLAVIKTDGQLARILDDQGALPSADALAKASSVKVPDEASGMAKQFAISGAMSAWQVGYAGSRLLLLQPGGNPVIVEISPGGGIRKISLKMPNGTTANSIISSDRAWLLRCFLACSSSTGSLLEFDPESGEVIRRIDTKGTPPTSIFYAGEGSYFATWWDKENKRAFILKNK